MKEHTKKRGHIREHPTGPGRRILQQIITYSFQKNREYGQAIKKQRLNMWLIELVPIIQGVIVIC